ncbi:MAG: hypothetical protein IPG01_13280 [Chitinophagaceae bacterium]|nr:hypothetical protein [Chitinophagaceae bacterium]
MNTESNSENYQNKFAYELATALNDHHSIQVYVKFTQKYKEEFLRKILLRVMSIPDNKIKRTRGALFTYLVNQHGFDHSRN